MKTKRTLLKFAIAFAICFGVHILVSLSSNLIVNKFILNTQLANFTIYDSYADFSILLAYIPISALLIFNKIKGHFLIIASGWFACFVLFKAFIVDMIRHYLRFYVNTNQNGNYSFEVFKDKLTGQWDGLLFEFSNLGQFLSFVVWVFIALLGVCCLSLWARIIDR